MSGRVLIARLDSLGDVVLAGPAVRAVAAGGDEVWMLCSEAGAPAARLLPGVHRVLEWNCPWITAGAPDATPAHLDELATLLREADPDVAVILTSFHQSPLPLALQLRLAGVPRIVGASVDGAGSLLDVRLIPGEDFPEDQPEALRALTIAQAAGFDLPPGDDGLLRLRPLAPMPPAMADAPYVVVHPGASVPARAWPSDTAEEVVRLLHAAGVPVAVTGGERERPLTAAVAGDAAEDLGGALSVEALASLLAGAAVVVSGNTGPAHIAAAVGTPVVSLFSPVVPAERWAPYGVPSVLLGDQQERCRGTRARACPVPGHPCLSGVTADEIVGAVARLAPALRAVLT